MKTLRVLLSSQLIAALFLIHTFPIAAVFAEDSVPSAQEPATETTLPVENTSQSETSSTETETSNATEEETIETSESLETSSEGSSSSETHANTTIEASGTTTPPTPELSGIIDAVQEIATTTSIFGGSTGDGIGGGNQTQNSTESTSTIEIASTTSVLPRPDATTTPDEVPEMASGTPTVISGASVAVANILNILNSTFLNSSGSILFSNYTDEAGTIDFRNPTLFLGLCDEISCSGNTGIQLNLLQDAHIDNNIVISANSGENELESSGEGAIHSGTAFAGLNLVNLANLTVANSNYLLIALNAFRGVNGDIVFPALDSFFAPLLNASSSAHVADLHNSGAIENDVRTGANSGDNTVETGEHGSSTILAGTAGAHTNIFNQINSLLAGSGLSILFRISGTWTGEVQGAPEGVTWTRTPEGLLVTGSSAQTSGDGSLTTISGTSTSLISNRAQVGALSGSNDLTASTTALLSTGDAFAGANIINVANQTVVGRNWIMAIINIFGDFDGNITFGKPDLWVGAQAQAPGTISAGSLVEYKITVLNNGDAVATDSYVAETIDTDKVRIRNASHAYEQEGSTVRFALGSIPAGGAAEISYTAEVTSFRDGESITSESEALLHESDFNPGDNRDSTSVRNAVFTSGYSPTPLAVTPVATPATSTPQTVTVRVSRESESQRITDSDPTAHQTVIVRNESSSPAYDVVIHDLVKNENGEIIHEELFDIGVMAGREEVTIQYDISFATAAAGSYSLWSEIVGSNMSSIATRNGEIVYAVAAPEVLLASTSIQTVAPARIERTTPRIPNTGVPATAPVIPDTWTQEDSSAIAQTAAAGAIDTGVADTYRDVVSYALLLAMVFGALRVHKEHMRRR